jgi:hypothetical protein
MSESKSESKSEPPGPPSMWAPILRGAGLLYLALGGLLAVAWAIGEVDPSLFPTGWIFPAVLLTSGVLMTARRRFDLVVTLWAGLSLAVFVLAALTYTDALTLGLDDAAAFDSAIIVAAFGLVALALRPAFRD